MLQQWSPRHCYIMSIDGNLSVFVWNLGPVAGPVFILYLLLQLAADFTVFREVLKSLKTSNLQQSSSHGLVKKVEEIL